MSLPAGVEYGYVRWQGLITVPDQTDLDDQPDADPSQGTVEFRADIKAPQKSATPYVLVTGATLFLPAQTYGIGSDGILRDAEGRERITLVSPESSGINPPDWTWTATFQLANGLAWGPVTFDLPVGAEVDLSDVAPVPSSSGTPIVRGPKGDPGGAFTTEDMRDLIGTTLVAGANVTITVDDVGDTVTIAAVGGTGESPALDNIPAGSTLTVQKDLATGFWPSGWNSDGTPSYASGANNAGVRPTARADVYIQWKGADPSPAVVSTGTNGMRDGLDTRFVTP